MDDHPIFEKLRQLDITLEQHAHLFGLITAGFKMAINARSPKNRPPGKAGLRAEKGYYRLLYLEGALHDDISTHAGMDNDTPAYNWESMIAMIRQLTDIPELRSEIIAAVENALDEIGVPTQTSS